MKKDKEWNDDCIFSTDMQINCILNELNTIGVL